MIYKLAERRLAFAARSKHLSLAISGLLLLLTIFVSVAGSYHALNMASDTPHIDDWHFISDLEQFNQGDQGLSAESYYLKRHNGHPSVPARAAFLISAKCFDLNLQYIRYGTYFISLICFALLSFLAVVIQKRTSIPFVWILSFIAFCSLAVFSPNHWETYSLAMGITNMVATVAVIGSVIAGYWWTCGKGGGFLAISFSAALLATASMSQGMFVWTALAVLFLAGAPRHKMALIAVCCVTQLLAFLWNYIGYTGAGGGSQPLDVLRILLSVPILVSSPFFGMVSNNPCVPLSVSSGVVIFALCALGLLSVCLSSTRNSKIVAPFLALLCYGALTIALIALGRRDMPLELIAAPRYATLTMPFLIGAFGAISITAAKERWAAVALGGIFSLCLTGWLFSSQQEYALLEARRTTVAHIKKYLLSRSPYEDDDQSLREKLYIDGNTLKVAKRSIRFIKEQQMSIFSVPDPPVKAQPGHDAIVPAHSP